MILDSPGARPPTLALSPSPNIRIGTMVFETNVHGPARVVPSDLQPGEILNRIQLRLSVGVHFWDRLRAEQRFELYKLFA